MSISKHDLENASPPTKDNMPDPILDTAALDNLIATVGGDKSFLGELISTFLSDSPQQIAAMKNAAANASADELRRAAHSLKSNAANFGAMNLAQLARELEEMGKRGEMNGAGERIAQIEPEYARVRDALKAVIKS